LAAGMASGFTVVEAAEIPGGICASYYMRPGTSTRLPAQPPDAEAYRFELGGGHWIFGTDPLVQPLLQRLGPIVTHRRKATAFRSVHPSATNSSFHSTNSIPPASTTASPRRMAISRRILAASAATMPSSDIRSQASTC